MRHSEGLFGSFKYHPFEVTLCGYSGSGKTTLICQLLEHWGERFRVGFVKHDAHRFEMDKPGKDTYQAFRAGAVTVLINDPRHFARISSLPFSRLEQAYAFMDADFVIAEGHKHSDLPKLLFLEAAGRAWREFEEGRFTNVLGIVGPGPRPPAPCTLPYFQRDEVADIAGFIETQVIDRATTSLHGLILAGGESRRMGRPKWSLEYGGIMQLHRTATLLGDRCEHVYLSLRPGQQIRDARLPLIVDRFPAWGPAAGILSAMEMRPGAAWLVVSVDLPYLDDVTLDDLIAGRNPLKIATAYRSVHDGRPEPLCTIWEPRSSQRLLQAAGIDHVGPRGVLEASGIHMLDLHSPHALDNVNTPEEYHAALEALKEK